MEVTRVKLSELRHDDKNARKHDERNIEEIKRSITAFGQHRPFVVQRGTNKVIVGNGMLDAMLALGMTEGDAYFVDDDDETSIRRALADNRTGELAEWDMGTLKDLFQDMGPEPDVPGWDPDEIQDLFDWHDTGTGTESEIEEDEVPEVQEEAVSRLGDIWLLDKHRLMCGDCTQEDNVALLMGDKKADIVLTDPPYNVDYSSKNTYLNAISRGNRIQTPIENDKYDTDNEIAEKIWRPAFANMRKHAAEHCSIYCTMPQGGAHMMMMMASASWQVKHELIWVKNNHVLGRADYNYRHEPILFGWADKHKFYGKGDFLQSVWEIPKPQKSDLHPTMKPIGLITNALLNSSQQGDLCIDLFGGSGSTLIACEQTGRVCYMMELAPNYVDVIIRRWQNLTGKRAVNEKTGEYFPA